MSQVNAEEMYDWYVQDVIKRNDTLITFQEECRQLFSARTAEELLPILEKRYKEDNEYHMPHTKEEPKKEQKTTPKTDNNDFEMFQKNIRVNVIIDNFANHPETLAVKEDLIAARENGDDKALKEIIDGLYVTFGNEIASKKLEDKVVLDKLIEKSTEIFHRRTINDSFFNEVDSTKDKGNCTKGITVSLLHAEKEFGVSLFPDNLNKENLAHPKDLIHSLGAQYVKETPINELKPEDLKLGNIIIFQNQSKEKREYRHARMISGFNENGTPLLLEFSPTKNKEEMNLERTTICAIIDIHSFIADKVQQHNREELAQMMLVTQKSKNY
ncbi:MAG: hypothetical protein NC218_07715 [Acetobacter sp.]|nr:hypothetical protein [Acetobacter sp.]